MTLQSPEPGNYYEFDAVCSAGALLAFRVLQHCDEEEITSKKSGRKSKVQPVIADILVVDGGSNPALAKTVVRREKIIGRGLTGSLRRVTVGHDGLFRMAWGEGDNGHYPQANAVDAATIAWVDANVFKPTNEDPYSAAERAANPPGLQSPGHQAAPPAAAPAPVQSPVQPAYVPPPVQPAAAAPTPEQAPWGAPADPGQPVGGPSGSPLPPVPAAAPQPAAAVW